MRNALPYARAGQVIGLLGGSFDPAHEGHVQLTLEALKQFGLDRVWWLVSPGNPLKSRGPADIGKRLHRAAQVMDHPRVTITDLETQTGTRYTAETLEALQHLYPGVRFVWLMGADNLAQFHHWQDWQSIMASVPIGVLARPGDRLAARCSKAAQMFRAHRIAAHNSQALADGPAPRWCFSNMPMNAQSSSKLRATGNWP